MQKLISADNLRYKRLCESKKENKFKFKNLRKMRIRSDQMIKLIIKNQDDKSYQQRIIQTNREIPYDKNFS